ncbi:nicotinate-nucleotide--dimethylbenzimidazole phosphoribosyltransferase [Nocardioides sp. GXZ039]|uniref:nicotinate-nucleotide--dimethylbenzimidazole phosphoribosyltransferase n=1 Tax=Nocardioides sp. GXZ039 TaxID=3136018 RepID=UPI0030F3B1E2
MPDSSAVPAVSTADDIRALLDDLPGPDLDAAAAVRERDARLTKPPGSLGRVEDVVEWLAAWQRRPRPRLETPRMCVFAGSHGVVEQGVSAFPAEVTGQMIANFRAGGAAINQICRTHGIDLEVVDLGWERPTQDLTMQPAMDEAEFVEAFAAGMRAVPPGTDLLAIGEMGIGNTTSAAAIYAGLWGGAAEHWVGRGTGVDDEGLARKAAAVSAGLTRHADGLDDPLAVLARLGGREIAAMAGAILAARLLGVPVVLDGYVTTAAAAVLFAQEPTTLDHCLAGHVSTEGAHADVLARLGLAPLLDLGLHLGEGSGAGLAVGVLSAAVAVHDGMATFDEAGVADGGPAGG